MRHWHPSYKACIRVINVYVIFLYLFICMFTFTIRPSEARADILWLAENTIHHSDGMFKEKLNIKINPNVNTIDRLARSLHEENIQEKSFSYIEYKKISPVKYRLIIHGVSRSFILILTEIFHEGWKIYPVSFSSTNNNNVNMDGHNVVENKSLPNGVFYETFFLKSIDEVNHLKINDFANGWTIDAKLIENNFPYSIRKKNNMHDMEIVIEYMPQKIYLLGLLVSFSTFVISALFLLTRYRKNTR